MSREKTILILDILRAAASPVTGTELAERLGVSRQVVVKEIAIARAAGQQILATPQGYLLPTVDTGITDTIAVQHSPEQTREELFALVDCGLKVIDVIVEHPVYGELRGLLMLESRADVEKFMERIRDSKASLLLTLTEGVHLHTVIAKDKESLQLAKKLLKTKGLALE